MLYLLAIPLFIYAFYLYAKSFYHTIRAVNTGNISIITAIRAVGIFIPLLGIVMGFIKEPLYNSDLDAAEEKRLNQVSASREIK
jgi:hypothetical protein